MSKLILKALDTLKTNGLKSLWNKTFHYIRNNYKYSMQARECNHVVDVIFVNGCDDTLPHPTRYRVNHQMEQLENHGMTCSQVYYKNLQLEHLRYAGIFIFFRCPYTESIGEFLDTAKNLNKTVLYDVDDLVIDTKYTDMIPYVRNMSAYEKNLYDNNVNDMKKLLCKCDGAITTTDTLAKELEHYVNDVLINRNVASNKMVELSHNVKYIKSKRKITIGYFSGSITHNADFQMIIPVLVELFEKYTNLKLLLVGKLDIPTELKKYQDRIVFRNFIEWKKLPQLISEADINIAPIRKDIFNEAKSENKWIEAALVKVPTVASKVGAFESMINNHENGILCENVHEWTTELKKLIEDDVYRKKIGDAAYEYVINNCTTSCSGEKLVNFLKKKRRKNIAFFLPSEEISGGIMVAIRHAIFMNKAGYDVSFFVPRTQNDWMSSFGEKFPINSYDRKDKIKSYIDKGVATMWTTVAPLLELENVLEKYYLVQNFEPGFYQKDTYNYQEALKTYTDDLPLIYITISKWCKQWLEDDYNKKVRYVPNGIDLENFKIVNRQNKKTRILIEGDSEAPHKNVDESFEITNQLDKSTFEIWYMSYNGKAKDWYRCDKQFYNVPYDKVCEIYSKCDILLKSSKLESFSYPPLEMMATGGCVVVAPNEGNIEYLKDGYNCLMYEPGNIEQARKCIIELSQNIELKEILIRNSYSTVQKRDWSLLSHKIVKIYE